MNTKEVINVINSTPSYAKDALETLYHGKTFAAVRFNGHIDRFYKTRKGAQSHIDKLQRNSYYDEMTMEMATCGSDMEVFQINESDILNPINNIKIWYDYLKDTRYEYWTFENALHSAKYYNCESHVIEYLEKALQEMKENNCFSIIDEYETTNEVIEEVAATIETEIVSNESVVNELNEQIETNEETQPEPQTAQISYQTGTGNKGNGIEITFTEKPSEEVRNAIKAVGYRWGGKQRKNIWWAILSDETEAIAKQLAGETNINEPIENTFSYPEIEIDDNDNYTIPQNIQDAEHDGHWLFRSEKKDHNVILKDYFTQLTNEVKQIITTTENEYIIYKLKKTLQYFKKHYHQNYLSRLSNKASNPSWIVTGRAGRNSSRDAKFNSRYDKLMQEYIDLENDYKSRIDTLKNKIRNDKKQQLRNNIENTNVNIEFTTVTKEFMYMGYKEKKRVYAYGEYFICKLWNCYRLFHNGKEINIDLKTTDTLETAKKALTMYIQQKEEIAS
jgi:hypothetical protein